MTIKSGFEDKICRHFKKGNIVFGDVFTVKAVQLLFILIAAILSIIPKICFVMSILFVLSFGGLILLVTIGYSPISIIVYENSSYDLEIIKLLVIDWLLGLVFSLVIISIIIIWVEMCLMINKTLIKPSRAYKYFKKQKNKVMNISLIKCDITEK